MLLILIPLALVFFTIRERVDAIALTLTLLVFAFIDITILIDCCTLAMRLSGNKFTIIITAIFQFCGTKRYLLTYHTEWKHHQQDYDINI